MSARKKYRPRPVIANPLTLMAPAPKAKRDLVMMRFLTALQALTNGSHPGEEEWRSLSDAINTVEVMCELGWLKREEVMPDVTQAIAGMVIAANRFKAGQGMRLDAIGLCALRSIIAIYGDCLEGYTERQMALAQAETQVRIDRLMRSARKSKTDKVVML